MTETIKPRIFCVDDEPQVLRSTVRLLRGDFQVVTAESGQAALEQLRKDRQFAVIVSDMRMPEMDGATFLTQARLLVPNAARVLLTGQADLESVIRAVNGGSIHFYLQKPTEKIELIRVLHSGVSTHRENCAQTERLKKVVLESLALTVRALRPHSPGLEARVARVNGLSIELAAALELSDDFALLVGATLASVCKGLEPESRASLVDALLGSDVAFDSARMVLDDLWSKRLSHRSALSQVIQAAMRIESVEKRYQSASERHQALSDVLEPRILRAWQAIEGTAHQASSAPFEVNAT